MADQNANDVFELFSVPIAGGPVTRLNSPLVANGDVDELSDSYLISPASDRVVYLADQERNEVFELFAVPLEGGEPRKVNGSLVELGNVTPTPERVLAFQLAGNRVLYRADQDQYRVFELYLSSLTWDDQSAPHARKR